MEVNYRQKRLTEEEKIRIVTDYNAGMKIPDIMQRYGVSSVMTIYRTLKTMANRKVAEEIITEFSPEA